MRRVLFAAALLLAGLTAALVLGSGQLRAGAQGSTPTAAGPGFVGAWRVTVSSPGRPPFRSLTTFLADGTVLNATTPVRPAGGGAPLTVTSAGHGVWQQTGPTTAVFTFVALETDAQGHSLGTLTVSGRVTLGVDGNSWSGPASLTIAAPSGKVLRRVAEKGQGTRITVQPLATPGAGTPAA